MTLFIFFLVGVCAGFLNTLAGGGSILAVPVMVLLLGIDSLTALATNRMAILIQNLTGSIGFYRYRKLNLKKALPLALLAALGAIPAVFFAFNLSARVYDIIFGTVLVFIVIYLFLPGKEKSYRLPLWLEMLLFVLIGAYGGFIQVGIGFILIAAIKGLKNIDLVEANAIKSFVIFVYTIPVFVITAFTGKLIWKYSIIFTLGNILGTLLGVRIAVKKGDKIIKFALAFAVGISTLKLFKVF